MGCQQISKRCVTSFIDDPVFKSRTLNGSDDWIFEFDLKWPFWYEFFVVVVGWLANVGHPFDDVITVVWKCKNGFHYLNAFAKNKTDCDIFLVWTAIAHQMVLNFTAYRDQFYQHVRSSFFVFCTVSLYLYFLFVNCWRTEISKKAA